jgi:hypothetical protein
MVGKPEAGGKLRPENGDDVPPKRLDLSELQGITTQKTALLIVTAVRK